MPLFQAGTVPGPSMTSSVPLFSLSIRPISTLWTPSRTRSSRLPRPFAASGKPDPKPEPGAKPKARRRRLNPEPPREGDETVFPKWRPRRGRRTETEAVEDFVRNRLEQTFKTIREQNPGRWEEKGNNVMKEVKEDEDEVDEERTGVMEEDSEAWPVDAEVGWGIRASEYFEKHAIKNVVGEDGLEIDWEGELDDTWVQEINCLEWERFAFHPSPLVVLAFERYNNASENWKTLKELEKAAKVYWSTKDRLPPRTVKLDINIEKDLAYALKVRECPQILFLKGQRMLYREKGFRTADELVQMIAHFYYNAKKPSCMKDAD